MKDPQLYEKRKKDLIAVSECETPDRIPVMLMPGAGMYAYGNTTLRAALDDDPQKGAQAFTKLYDDMWVDCVANYGWSVTQKAYEAMRSGNSFIGPDDITIEHISNPLMKDDEYAQLIADPSGFAKNVLLPRKYSWIFDGELKPAVKALETVINDSGYVYGVLNAAIEEKSVNDYMLVGVGDDFKAPYSPLDEIFYNLRGFSGTFSDLHRRPKEVIEACDVLWGMKELTFEPVAEALPYAHWYALIPTYLNRKQFEKFYWPYFKKQIEDIYALGTKTLILLEGKWMQFAEFLCDLPKNSCILHVDDDDVIEFKKKLNGYQAVAGGVHSSKLAMASSEACLNEAKEIIEHCAPDGGFIYTNGKALISASDVNQNLIDTFNYVHENGKY